MVDAGPDPLYEEKRVTHPSQAPWDTQILFCDKNTLLQRGSVYTKKLKRLIGQAGWLTDWLTDWESKQTDSYILLHTALKHWSAFWREGWGVWHTDIIIYKKVLSIFGDSKFWIKFFIGGGGGGAGDQKNKYVWRYDEIMIYFLYVLVGGHFYQFWAF